MKPKNEISNKPLIHPVWMLAALPALLLLLFSDAGNNLAIVHRFASGELSLWSWQGLAIGAALAAAPLGYASGVKQWMIMPTAVVVILGGILTLMSTQTDFKGKSVDAQKYQADFAALESERANLIKSLNPTDGSAPCKHLRWCDSQAKEQRLAQINTMTNFVDTTVDPLSTPGGEFFAKCLAVLRAFGVPAVVASLAHCLGLMFHGSNLRPDPLQPNRGRRLSEYEWNTDNGYAYNAPANSNPVTANAPKRVHDNNVTAPILRGVQRDTGIEGKAAHRYEELRKNVLSGHVKPSIRQVRTFCGCRQDVAIRYLNRLSEEGIITKTQSGRCELNELHSVRRGEG
jgi:hypothetical protein